MKFPTFCQNHAWEDEGRNEIKEQVDIWTKLLLLTCEDISSSQLQTIVSQLRVGLKLQLSLFEV